MHRYRGHGKGLMILCSMMHDMKHYQRSELHKKNLLQAIMSLLWR
jgi:hypothetical protein